MKKIDELIENVYEARKEKSQKRDEIVENILKKILNIFQVSTDHAIIDEDMVWDIKIDSLWGRAIVYVKTNDNWHRKDYYLSLDSNENKSFLYNAMNELEEEINKFSFSAPDKIFKLLNKNLQGKKFIETGVFVDKMIISFSPKD